MNDPTPNYIAWAITIAIAVVIGNLASNWITAQYAEFTAEQALQAITRATQQQADSMRNQANAIEQRNAEVQRFQLEKAQQQRAGDVTGSKLARLCEEWTRTYEQIKSGFALQERNKFCTQRDAYVNNGTQPRPY